MEISRKELQKCILSRGHLTEDIVDGVNEMMIHAANRWIEISMTLMQCRAKERNSGVAK